MNIDIDLINKYLQERGIKLGLSHEQVLTPNFGQHTIDAIKAEIKKGISLQDAFEKYNSLDRPQVKAITKLGLSREQVLTPNFGPYTFKAIKAEIKKGIPLQDAFEKYDSLDCPQIEAITKLGLSREQVLTPNFGEYTIDAIEAEIKKGNPLQDAFEKYNSLDCPQIEAITKLGLSLEQVLTPNFGQHTIDAIKAEIKKGIPLQDAFEKYDSLDYPQVKAITKLGLNREQVLTPNFGWHTIDAIENIQKRTKDITVNKAFKLVQEKTYRETNEFLNSYLQATKIDQKSISEMDLIKVVVNTGRGFGHQKAAITLMENIREMGFTGTFDIQCQNSDVYEQLKTMIPEFSSSKNNDQRIIKVQNLGTIKISTLPNNFNENYNLNLPKADLAVCAADDWIIGRANEKKIKIFNSSSYISLEPTDWHLGSCFVVDQDGIITKLPPASTMRLTSKNAYQKLNISSIKMTDIEKKILEIVNNNNVISQIVYGLYPEKERDFESIEDKMKLTGHLDEVIEMQRIVESHLILNKVTNKISIILVPQEIALNSSFINKVKGGNQNIHFVDITQKNLDISKYKSDDIVITYTGHLQQSVFDYLMLQATTLPPIIEGCNAREACESIGRPFIHGSSSFLKQYSIKPIDKQKLHFEASRCLQLGNKKYLPQLVQYMEESLQSNLELLSYHKQRQEAFQMRPNACKVAFDSLGIKYNNSLQSLESTFSQNDQTKLSGDEINNHFL